MAERFTRSMLLKLPCTACGAKAGERCVAPSGRPTNPHAARWHAYAEADHD